LRKVLNYFADFEIYIPEKCKVLTFLLQIAQNLKKVLTYWSINGSKVRTFLIFIKKERKNRRRGTENYYYKPGIAKKLRTFTKIRKK